MSLTCWNPLISFHFREQKEVGWCEVRCAVVKCSQVGTVLLLFIYNTVEQTLNISSSFPCLHEESDRSLPINVHFICPSTWGSFNDLWPPLHELLQLLPDFKQLMAAYSFNYLQSSYPFLNFLNHLKTHVWDKASYTWTVFGFSRFCSCLFESDTVLDVHSKTTNGNTTYTRGTAWARTGFCAKPYLHDITSPGNLSPHGPAIWRQIIQNETTVV
jgi:hypothetical protein